MKRLTLTILLLGLALSLTPGSASAGLTVEFFGGASFNFVTPLTIHQDGEDDINMMANYDSQSFEEAWYYAYRIGWWKDNAAWELELVHHKLILRDSPPEIEQFQISHGYNLITLNRAYKYKGFVFHFGGGIVYGHPESTIRGKTQYFKEGTLIGFYVTGLTSQVAVGKRFPIWKGLFLQLETKLTASYAWYVPIVDGYARVPNLAAHLLWGVGYDF